MSRYHLAQLHHPTGFLTMIKFARAILVGAFIFGITACVIASMVIDGAISWIGHSRYGLIFGALLGSVDYLCRRCFWARTLLWLLGWIIFVAGFKWLITALVGV